MTNMFGYKTKRVKKITPEFIDAMKIYLHIDGVDIKKLKKVCEYLDIYGMDISKFIKCKIDLAYSDEVMFTSELFSLQDLLATHGKAYIVKTPKITFVDFELTKTIIKDHLIYNIKSSDSYFCPYELSNFSYYNNELVHFVEVHSNSSLNLNRLEKLSHYFDENGYFSLRKCCKLPFCFVYEKENTKMVNSSGTYYYNKFNHLVLVDVYDDIISDRLKTKIHNEYDENNNLIRTSYDTKNINYSKEYTYDSHGNCITEKFFENGNIKVHTKYHYTFRRNKIDTIYKTTQHFNGRSFGNMLFKRRVCSTKPPL